MNEVPRAGVQCFTATGPPVELGVAFSAPWSLIRLTGAAVTADPAVRAGAACAAAAGRTATPAVAVAIAAADHHVLRSIVPPGSLVRIIANPA